ncbi:MAG: hypothetical protein OEX81_00075 [Candidatus Pacebacteria bacterium]|nr:hypothetical protein [Candidatus Paceibacterota bacterium]
MPNNEILIHGTGSLSQYEGDGDDYDRYYLPARAIIRALADRRQGLESHIILPGTQLDETVNFLNDTLSPNDTNLPSLGESAYRTPDEQYLMWQEVEENIEQFILWLVENNLQHALLGLLPYASSEDYWSVYETLVERGFNIRTNMDRLDDAAWLENSCFAHKGAYFEWINNSIRQEDLTNYEDINRPTGYVACSPSEATLALNRLRAKLGDGPVLFKPIYGGGGYGIKYFNSILEAQEALDNSTYQFEYNTYDESQLHPILIQEAINIQYDDMGEVGISVQFNGKNIIGLTRTLGDGSGHWSGNLLINSENSQAAGISHNMFSLAETMTRQLLSEISPDGRGGIDFLVSNNNGSSELHFIELNGGRTTGAEEAVQFERIVQSNNGVTGLHKYSIDPNSDLTIHDIAELLRTNGNLFSFDENDNPVFGLLPIICIGDHLTVVGYARNHQELHQAFQLLSERL